MSQTRKKQPTKVSPAVPSPAAGPGHLRTVIALLAVALIAAAVWWSRTRPVTAPAVAPVAASAVPAPAATPAVNPHFAPLKGRWLRPDGGYVLEIRGVGADGALEAGYLNPRPIHVAKAAATQEGAAVKVFIELRDTGYPGCTYNLVFQPAADRLTGSYFQAALGQNFDVEFTRLPAEAGQ